MGIKLHTFSNGFKNARKNTKDENGKSYTQQSFADAFNVSVETVKNWEQGRATPEIDTINALCDFFHCDIDYLFDRIDVKTHNVKFIRDYTGLSEKSVETLNQLNTEFPDSVESLNMLLESAHFTIDLMQQITMFKNQEILHDTFNEDGEIINSGVDADRHLKEIRFDMSESLTRIVDDIKEIIDSECDEKESRSDQ